MEKKMLNVVYLNGATPLGKGRGSSKREWTGHVDVEGLKAIGWNNEDIAYFQEHGVNWNEEDDEYYKVSDDNKALYGVLTADNIQEYRDRIVWLPKIDLSEKVDCSYLFENCKFMIGIPMINIAKASSATAMFRYCISLRTIPVLDYSKIISLNSMFSGCSSLVYLPKIYAPICTNITTAISGNYSIRRISIFCKGSPIKIAYSFSHCYSLESIDCNFPMYCSDNAFSYCYSLTNIHNCFDDGNLKTNSFYLCKNLEYLELYKLKSNLLLEGSEKISKKSILLIINNEETENAITITLHANAYTRLSTDPDIVEALNNHPLVSLASE